MGVRLESEFAVIHTRQGNVRLGKRRYAVVHTDSLWCLVLAPIPASFRGGRIECFVSIREMDYAENRLAVLKERNECTKLRNSKGKPGRSIQWIQHPLES